MLPENFNKQNDNTSSVNQNNISEIGQNPAILERQSNERIVFTNITPQLIRTMFSSEIAEQLIKDKEKIDRGEEMESKPLLIKRSDINFCRPQ